MKTLNPLLVAVCLAVSNVSAQSNNPVPAAPPVAAAPARAHPINDPGVRKLSRRDRKERIRNLPEKFQNFLHDVEPIIVPTEVNAFLLLESDAQRDVYIDAFWKLRDTDPKTIYNEYHDTYYERLEEAKQKFKYQNSDRARAYLIQGRPDDLIATDCSRYLVPIEVWFYEFLPGKGHKVFLLFYQPRTGGDYTLWQPQSGDTEDLEKLLSVEGVRLGVQEVFFGSAAIGGARVSRVGFECNHGDAILQAIFWTQANKMDVVKLFDPPAVSQEAVADILRSAVLSNPAAPKLIAEFSVRYPGKRGSMTDAEMTVLLEASQLTAKEIAGVSTYSVDVTGELLKDEKMFENFRYRFDFPAGSAARLPITIERFLRPADYKPRIKLVDANSGAEALVESSITVPAIDDTAEQTAKKDESEAAFTRLQQEVRSGEDRLRIVPLSDDLLSGLQHIETLISGDSIKAVEFYLDNKKVMVKRAPPFTLDLDLGSVPQVRKVKAVGLDGAGKVVSGDDLVLNTGSQGFKVRIAHPRVAKKVSGKVRVEIEPTLPDGKTLDHIDLFLNEQKLATLYDPPYVQTVNIPESQTVGYLRVVATLKDADVAPVEDVVFINSPDFMEQVDVHLVELPITVVRGGKPVAGLEQKDFTVLDEGKSVKISRFDYVTKLPLSIGLTIDTSESMRPRMFEAQKAAASFFQNVLRPGDKAFVVAFSSQPTLVQKWSSRLTDLDASIAGLRAEQATAIFDAIVFSLYNFQGLKGQKALIVLTDGKDTASKFSFDQALEYARRASIPIYTIGLGIPATDIDARYKMGRFSAETGGSVYQIQKAEDLAKIYGDIQSELRSQYLLGIYPPDGVKSGSKWREVRVDVKEGKAKTIRGYYP